MAADRKLYSLFLRKKKPDQKGKPVYYVRFRRQDGTWTAGKSSGHTSKGAAEAWAQNYLKSGQVVETENITLEAYAKAFYGAGGNWATDRRLSGKRISERVCIENQATTDTRIIPLLGKKKLTDIDKAAIKEFRRDLSTKKGLAHRTINKTLSCLKMILEYAEEEKLIQAVPKIEKASNTGETRGILNPDEVKKLFHEATWNDPRAYTANLTAAATGCRMGEILGLKRANVKSGYLEIIAAWNQRMRCMNPTTKTGRSRYVPMPTIVQEKIRNLMELSPWQDPEDFIFYSSNRNNPWESKNILDGLYFALASIGTAEPERNARRIDFHSWRHFFNSYMINRRVPLVKVMSMTGHLTEEMASNYYHTDPAEMRDVILIQEDMLSPAPVSIVSGDDVK